MNKAESQRIADYLELYGYEATSTLKNADLIVLNTCVVRQSAEDKVIGTLGYLKGIKMANPLAIIVTGCFVDSNTKELKTRFPQVDLFFKPGAYHELISWIKKQDITVPKEIEYPLPTDHPSPSAFVPISQGCNNFCSYCIVPYRRGREKSRPVKEIICEVANLVKYGAREVTLLGQNVNSYGHDLPAQPDLSDLLNALNDIDDLVRIRFITNHPKDMSQKLIETISSLHKVCEHISLPFQSGDNNILSAMRRGYTIEKYRHLIGIIRRHIPRVALSTDVIVGFPDETDEQFGRSVALLEEIRFDTVHVAAYSPRPNTIAASKLTDDVSQKEKKRRLVIIEQLQEKIATEINMSLLGKTLEILVEGKQKGKWYGRTSTDKLVFFKDTANHLGKLVNLSIVSTSPWSLQGTIDYID